MENARVDPAHHVIGRIAQQALGAAVEQGDHALRVGGHHRHFVGRIDQRLQPLAHFRRVLPGLLQLGHIIVGAGHPHRAPLPVPLEHAPAVVDPDPAAVLVAHAQQARIVVGLPAEVLLQRGIGTGQVIGMHQRLERILVHRLQFFLAVTDDLGPARIDAHLARLHVPLPGARCGAFDDHREAAAVFGQLHQAPLDQVAFVVAGAAHQRSLPCAQARAGRSARLQP